MLATGQFDMAYVPWPMGADPDDSFLVTCHGAAKIMRYCNPASTRSKRRRSSPTARTARQTLYARNQARASADVPIVYLFNPTYVYAYRNA